MKLNEINPLTEDQTPIKHFNTKYVHCDDIPSTLTYVSKLTGIPKNDLHKIGSTGKKQYSGDIDLAIDCNKYAMSDINQIIQDQIGKENCYLNKGTQIASYVIPIAGDQEKGNVQVDLMFTPNIEWAKFSYHSEGEKSKYKGAIRTILLKAIATTIHEPDKDYFEYDGDLLTVRSGRTFDLNKGLRRIFQYRPNKKDGSGYLKNMKTVSFEQLKDMFPEVAIRGGQMVIDNPEQVTKKLFGAGIRPEHLKTAEEILYYINKKFDEETKEQIFDVAKEHAKDLKQKMKIPEQLRD